MKYNNRLTEKNASFSRENVKMLIVLHGEDGWFQELWWSAELYLIWSLWESVR